MSDAPAAPVAAAPKAKKAAKPKAKPTHPTTAVMVAAAITALKDKKGSSRPAIKKYIAANYKVDIVKLGPHLKKALKTGVEKKTLVALKDKKGSSHAAIKKYIAANHRVDIVKLGPHLKKALKAGVGKKTLVVRDRLALPSRTTPCYHTTLKDCPGTQGFSLYQKFMIAHYL